MTGGSVIRNNPRHMESSTPEKICLNVIILSQCGTLKKFYCKFLKSQLKLNKVKTKSNGGRGLGGWIGQWIG